MEQNLHCKNEKECTPKECGKSRGRNSLKEAEEVEKRKRNRSLSIHNFDCGERKKGGGEEKRESFSLSLFLSLRSVFPIMAASGAASMMPLRALPATGGNANANKANAALAKGCNTLLPNSSSVASAARRAAVLLLASPGVVEHGGEDLLLAVARLLRGVATRGRDLGGGSAEWAYDLLLPDPAMTSTSAMAATGEVDDGADNNDAEKQRRASSCAAAAASGRAVAEAWKSASGALRWNASGESEEKTHSFASSFFFLPSTGHLSPTAPTFFRI